jgi:phosphohistidine phosphatase
MKTLSILRHAKAERPEDFASDLERPLTARGHKDAARMGELLADLTPRVDWVISSPAQRTRETTAHIVHALAFKRAVLWQEAVYEAEADALLQLLAQTPSEMEHVVLIGHNPGMEMLVSGLSAGAPNRLGVIMAPGGLAHLTLDIMNWQQLRWGSGTLHFLLRPKLLRG